MKAIHLLNYLKVGGGQSVALNYSKILKNFNVDCTFFGVKYQNGEYEDFVSNYIDIVHKIDRNLIKSMDYIFIHTNKNLFRIFLYRFLPLGWRNKKVIYIQHLNYSPIKFFFLSILINTICSDFIQITPITSRNVNKFIRIKKHFIVNFKLLSYKETDWGDIRKSVRLELGYNDDDVVFVYSARFMEGKNVSKFVELAKCFPNDNHYKFLLLGDGPEDQEAKDYKAENYKWIGFQSDVEKFLIASDVYLFVSLYKLEMLPMALVEAINYNLSIAAFDTEINRFLLDGHVYQEISMELLKEWRSLPNGANLKQYGYEYAVKKIKELVNRKNEKNK